MSAFEAQLVATAASLLVTDLSFFSLYSQCKVIDSEGNTLPVGKPGELLTKGYLVMNGYWNQEEKTKDSIRDGFMCTGDLAVIDEDGFCKIVGRIKDTIIRGGENISPREVEEFLYTHPKVKDVQVVGVPDDTLGEQVCAWIHTKQGETLTDDEVKAFCKGQIAHYKIPKYYVFNKDWPMTISGKIQKFKMRDMSVELLDIKTKIKSF